MPAFPNQKKNHNARLLSTILETAEREGFFENYLKAALKNKATSSSSSSTEEKPWKIFFTGPYASNAPDLMRAAEDAARIPALPLPGKIKEILASTGANAVKVDMGFIRKAVLESNFIKDRFPEIEKMSIYKRNAAVRAVVSVIVHGLYGSAKGRGCPIWTNESLSPEKCGNVWMAPAFDPYRVAIIGVSNSPEILSANAKRHEAEGISVYTPEEITASRQTFLRNMEIFEQDPSITSCRVGDEQLPSHPRLGRKR